MQKQYSFSGCLVLYMFMEHSKIINCAAMYEDAAQYVIDKVHSYNNYQVMWYILGFRIVWNFKTGLLLPSSCS